MSNAIELLNKLNALGVQLSVDGDNLRYKPASVVPPDLVNQMRQRKVEIIRLLRKPELVEAPSEWHAETIAAAVQEEGICIFWSELFGEMVAFIKDDKFKNSVPCGIVAYNDQELRELFGNGKPSLPAASLRLIHEAKKASNGRISSHVPKQEGEK